MSRAKLHHCPQVLRLVGWKASISYTENMGMTFIVVTLQVLQRQLHFATSNLSATADYFTTQTCMCLNVRLNDLAS